MKEKIVFFVFLVLVLVGVVVGCSSFQLKTSDTEIVVEKIYRSL